MNSRGHRADGKRPAQNWGKYGIIGIVAALLTVVLRFFLFRSFSMYAFGYSGVLSFSVSLPEQLWPAIWLFWAPFSGLLGGITGAVISHRRNLDNETRFAVFGGVLLGLFSWIVPPM